MVDEWTSEGKVHFANNLEEGKSYILHEDLSPLGLNLANDIKFEVTYDKENQKVEMIDTINDVSKVKEDGKQLKGAELTVVSNKTKQIVDRWTTGQHIFDVTEDMQSQIKENKKAEGMYIDEDDSTITYSISKNKERDDYRLVFVKDGTTTYANIDLNGDETSHMIEGLIAGEEYVLRETKTPNGYATSKEQTFKAEKNKDISLTMIDEDIKVQINKQDITNKKEIEGAKLKVVDKDGNTIDEWLHAAEYIMKEGNNHIILCERGIKTFENATRNTLDISSIPVVKHLTKLPIIVDPSHAAGRRDLIESLSLASIAAGADGLLIETHLTPSESISDSEQAIDFDDLEKILKKIKKVALLVKD